MNKLIFNSLNEAVEYSNKHYNGQNIIYDLKTNKQLKTAQSRKAFFNPGLYVKDAEIPVVNKFKKKDNKSKVLKRFDELCL